MREKSGVTIVSLIVYVVLLAGITGIAAFISSGFNGDVLEEKGIATNMSSLLRAIYSVNESARYSDEVTLSENKIEFSNGDIFKYNPTTRVLYKNDGAVCDNITEFTVSNVDTDLYRITLKMNKYNSEVIREIDFCLGA